MKDESKELRDAVETGKVKILHLHYNLMNLYGDYANPKVLERELSGRGFEASIDRKSVGDAIDFDAYDFIFIGSGTERSQLASMRDLARYKDVLIARINAGVPVLATGNSHEFFGQAVTDKDGKRHEMLGLLDFETIQLNTRVTGDCVCKASFLDDKLIGFINRAGGGQKGDIERPFFIEPGEGASYKACDEGIKYKNLLGTYLTGPVLVRNPPLLKYFADVIREKAELGDEYVVSNGQTQENRPPVSDSFFEYQEKAYKTALSKL